MTPSKLLRLGGFALPLLAVAFSHAEDRPKLTAEKWSADINVPDPVACSVDDQGHVFVSTTTRRKVGDLDIREWTQWIPDDQSLTSIEEKEAFLHRALPPGGPKPKGPLTDANGDGTIDWKDLTVPTERIYRLVDSNADGKADQITTFAETFNTEVTGIAAGVLAFGGSVYTTIAPDLWRLGDKNGDGKSDNRESIAHGFGLHIAYAGHDMHGLRVGPDGRIYWSIGDKGVNVTSREGRHFFYPNQGCVLRCEPDGSHFEVFAHGLRNVQETDFNELGDLFGVDNDADKPGEKERLVFITDQSDSGWRCGFQFMKGDWCPWTSEGRWQPENPLQPLFITPPIVNSHDGPAGFAYNPGTALAPAWRGWFFLDQFPSGKMNALRLESAGAAWRLAEDVPISSGIMGIGMSWGPEGKLYFADWIGGYPLDGKGAVWTLDAEPATRDPLRAEVQARLREGFEKLTPPALRKLLGHADVRLRKGAQFELVKRGAWSELLTTSGDEKAPQLARLHAVWGLGQGLRWGKWNDVPALIALAGSADSEVRTQTAKILGEAPTGAAFSSTIATLIGDTNPRVRLQAALAAGRLKTTDAAAPLLAVIRKDGLPDPWMRHALVTGLAGCAKSADLAAAAKSPDRTLRLVSLLALARTHDRAVADFLSDSDPALAAEAAIAIHDDLGIPDALPLLAEWLTIAPDGSSEPALRRAVNANFRIGTPEAAVRVAAFAIKHGAPSQVREEALAQLTMWIAPPLLDHTDGRYRKLDTRDAEPLRAALQTQAAALLALDDPRLRALGLEVLLKFRLNAPAPQLAAVIADGKIAPAVRLESLRLLAAQDPASLELSHMLGDWLALPKGKQPAPLRAEALRLLATRDKARALATARTLTVEGETAEQQAAWEVLAILAMPEADAFIAENITQLTTDRTVPLSTRLDLLEAAEVRATASPNIAAGRDAFLKIRDAKSDPVDTFAECLEGGDAAAGREVALGSVVANCVACHRFDSGSGSEVGPALEGIASRHDRRYLLESLVAPSAQIAPGFGLVTVTKKGGEILAGTLLKDDKDAMRLRLPDGKELRISHAEITAQTPALSVMPPMGAILNRHQLRDVVAYLATLQTLPKLKNAKPKSEH